MAYVKEERFELRYSVPTANGDWNEKRIVCNSKQKLDSNKAKCKEYGYKVVSAKKLYPFNVMKNQHNFSLINDICFNTMRDMENGVVPYNNEEYIKLEQMREKADRFMCAMEPIVWIPYEDWKDAKELSEMAILHRQEACIAAGRPDLVALCAQ